MQHNDIHYYYYTIYIIFHIYMSTDININYLRNYYSILGCSNTIVDKNIFKKNYYRLSKIYHPDSETGDKDAFELVNEAYIILTNPKLKSEYDLKSTHGCNYIESEQLIDLGEDSRVDYKRYSDLKLMESLHIIDFIDYSEYKEKKYRYSRNVRCGSCDGKGIDLSIDYDEEEICDCLMCISQSQEKKDNCVYCGGLGKMGYNTCKKCAGKKLKSETVEISVKLNDDGITIFERFGSLSKNNMGLFGDLILIDRNLSPDDKRLIQLSDKLANQK